MSPTDQCFQHEKGVSLESRYEGTKIFTPCPQKIGFWAQKRPNLTQNCAWDEEEVARVGEGEEDGLVGSAEPGDPNLAGGPVLPMKL